MDSEFLAYVRLLLQGSCALKLHQPAKCPGSVRSYALVVESVLRYLVSTFFHLAMTGNKDVNSMRIHARS